MPAVASLRLPECGAGCYVSPLLDGLGAGVIQKMNLSSLIEPIQHVSYAIDDGTLALMALLAGMIGGWKITGWREQLKAKRVRVEKAGRPGRERR